MQEINLWKKYYFREDQLFYRRDVDDDKHLMKMAGNTPGFNKALYEKHREEIKWIGAVTLKGVRFLISREDFEKYRFEKAFAEPQYFVGRERWTIREPEQTQESMI